MAKNIPKCKFTNAELQQEFKCYENCSEECLQAMLIRAVSNSKDVPIGDWKVQSVEQDGNRVRILIDVPLSCYMALQDLGSANPQ